MAETPSQASGNHNAGGRLISQIQDGMDVEDVAGEHVGKVTFIRIGDPSAIDVELGTTGHERCSEENERDSFHAHEPSADFSTWR